MDYNNTVVGEALWMFPENKIYHTLKLLVLLKYTANHTSIFGYWNQSDKIKEILHSSMCYISCFMTATLQEHAVLADKKKPRSYFARIVMRKHTVNTLKQNGNWITGELINLNALECYPTPKYRPCIQAWDNASNVYGRDSTPGYPHSMWWGSWRVVASIYPFILKCTIRNVIRR